MSYAKAADELGLSPSGVSRIISRLEERLGVRLVQRTTRRLSLTETGSAFLARTSQILIDLADAEAEVRATVLEPKGNLRVSAPVVFGQLYLAPLLDHMLKRFPLLTVELHLVDRFVDLVDEGIDIAIRIGNLSDSRLIARRLCTNTRVLVASPSYLEKHGTPCLVSDLAEHNCVRFTGFSRPHEWKLKGPDGLVSVNVSGTMASNNLEVLTNFAKRGLGVTCGATLSVSSALLSGELVRVLSDYTFESTSVFALYPSARQLSTKVRAMVDFMVESLCDPPAWDRCLVGKVPGFVDTQESLTTQDSTP